LILNRVPIADGGWRSLGWWLRAMCELLTEENGQDVVEYGILIATVAIVVLLAIGAFGQQIEGWFSTLAQHITTTGT
jgi:Flp pilus assembly pilin Flp